MFALGLIYAEYLTGALPAFDPTYHEAAIAVLNGSTLTIPPAAAPEPIAHLVAQMLLVDPAARPTVERVHATLMEWRSGAPTTAAPLKPPPTTGPPAAPSALRGKGLRLTGNGHQPATGTMSPATPADPSPVPVRHPDLPAPAGDSRATTGRPGGLVGKLMSRLEERRSR